MLYMTVWAIKHRTSVNNFVYENAEINIEVKHLLINNRFIKNNLYSFKMLAPKRISVYLAKEFQKG